MKTLPILFFCFAMTVSLQAGIPTPDSAMTFRIDKDSRKWEMKYSTRAESGFVAKFLLPGDTGKPWKEMVTAQAIFTHAQPSKSGLAAFAGRFKESALEYDPKTEVKMETLDDGSILLTYTSLAKDDICIVRFIMDKDAIHMLSYHVRPKLKQDETYKLWLEIIRTASLIPNPEKKPWWHL